MEEIQQFTEILDMDNNEDDKDIDDQLEGEQNRNGNTAIDVMYPEKFVVVGSWQEGRYQSALAICMWRRKQGCLQTKNWYLKKNMNQTMFEIQMH